MRLSKGIIYIDAMHFRAFHGVMPQERTVGGDFTVSIQVTLPLDDAADTDNVGDTVSYARIYDLVAGQMAQPSALIEHVAARIAKAVLQQFGMVQEVTVDLRKDNPPMGADCKGAGVRLTYCRQQKPGA